MSGAVLVQVDDLYRDFAGIPAVEGVSFELEQGDVLGFLGPNGAGKTTTMRVLTGNLAPSGGRVWINGIDLLDEPRRAKAAIGYLPEYPPLYRELTVDEYLRFCARLHRIPRERIAPAMRAAKARCGLDSMGARLIGNLSQGYQQRVGIAQAIIHTPDVVVLDEPTVGLDPIQIREIRDLIRDLGREHGVILSTHILPEVQATCNRVQIIHEGRLVFADTLAHLSERMAPRSLLVTLRHPPEAHALESIEGVDDVERLEDGRLRVHHTVDADPAETLAARAASEGWGLRALVPEERTLEQIFVELTATDVTGAATDDAEEAA